jgi:outer membrane lipoprotein carrier protein
VSRCIALVALLILCTPTFADEAAAARLGVLLQHMRQVEGRFEQRLLDEQGGVLQESSGTVLLSHPGRFRWQTEQPFEQLVVSDGTTVWQYDADLQQVVIRPLDRRADQVPSLLLSGEIEAVAALFDIAMVRPEQGLERFELVPREAGGLFASLQVSFRPAGLEQLVIADGFGQRTEVSFQTLTPVADVADAQFRFATPPGVDELIDD